jgi:hypothetical protein
MNYCESAGMPDTLPLKKFVLFWKGLIESDALVAASPLKPTLIGALTGFSLCQKPPAAPAKGKQKRVG